MRVPHPYPPAAFGATGGLLPNRANCTHRAASSPRPHTRGGPSRSWCLVATNITFLGPPFAAAHPACIAANTKRAAVSCCWARGVATSPASTSTSCCTQRAFDHLYEAAHTIARRGLALGRWCPAPIVETLWFGCWAHRPTQRWQSAAPGLPMPSSCPPRAPAPAAAATLGAPRVAAC